MDELEAAPNGVTQKWAFEDFREGQAIDLGPKTVTPDEVIEFAREFDPQPMHLDAQAGEASLLGGLAASGWHTCAMFMRMMCDAFLLNSTCQGAPGIDYVRWKRPVLAGDRLAGETLVTAARPSRSRPHLGLVSFRHTLRNQRDETVLELENTAMFRVRGQP